MRVSGTKRPAVHMIVTRHHSTSRVITGSDLCRCMANALFLHHSVTKEVWPSASLAHRELQEKVLHAAGVLHDA
eukprot:1136170-Pelagomonas_calceolata.AAC.4